jgi:DNA repair protein RecO (recombination protein O)
MLVKTQGIVIKNTSFGENGVISSIFTSDLGVKKYIVNSVKKSNAKIRMSSITPLNLIDLEVYDKPNANFNRIKELKCSPILIDIHTNQKKRSVAIFMLEIMNLILQDDMQDQAFFIFLQQKIRQLENESLHAFFLTDFMSELILNLGLLPSGGYTESTPYFDPEEMSFLPHYSLNTEEKETYQVFSNHINQFQTNVRMEINSKQNKKIFLLLTQIFERHFGKQRPLQSIAVIQDVLYK